VKKAQSPTPPEPESEELLKVRECLAALSPSERTRLIDFFLKKLEQERRQEKGRCNSESR